MIFAPFAGWIVDKMPRLRLVLMAVWWQKYCIAASSLLWLAKLGFSLTTTLYNHVDGDGDTLDVYFYLVVLNGALLSICNTVSRIAMERDWALVLAKASKGAISLSQLNSSLRAVDLVCDLIAPFVVALISSLLNVQWAMVMVMGVAFVSSVLEIPLIRIVHAQYKQELDRKGDDDEEVVVEDEEEQEQEGQENNRLRCPPSPPPNASQPMNTSNRSRSSSGLRLREEESRWGTCKRLWKLSIVTTCFSISFLYLTVLTLNTVMIAYLLKRETSLLTISIVRGISVVCGLVAAFTFEPLTKRIGSVARTGLVAVWSQVLILLLALTSIHLYSFRVLNSNTSLGLFLCSLCLSRWPLWTFDLSQQQLMQENVPETDLGFLSGAEISLQNLFTILAYGITMIWHSAEVFEGVPMHASFMAVLCGALSFTYYYLNSSSSSSFVEDAEAGEDEPLLSVASAT